MIPADTQILVIDDHDDMQAGGGWVVMAATYGVACHHLRGGVTKEEILASLMEDLERQPARAFVGTVLDVIFRGQPTGGLELWEELERTGLAPRFGRLLLTTKQESEEVAEFAERRRAMITTRLTLKHKQPVFLRFLKECGLVQ